MQLLGRDGLRLSPAGKVQQVADDHARPLRLRLDEGIGQPPVQERAEDADDLSGGQGNRVEREGCGNQRYRQSARRSEKFRAKCDTGDVKKYYSKFDVCVEVPLA